MLFGSRAESYAGKDVAMMDHMMGGGMMWGMGLFGLLLLVLLVLAIAALVKYLCSSIAGSNTNRPKP